MKRLFLVIYVIYMFNRDVYTIIREWVLKYNRELREKHEANKR